MEGRIKCPGCGAWNDVGEGKGTICKDCGAAIKNDYWEKKGSDSEDMADEKGETLEDIEEAVKEIRDHEEAELRTSSDGGSGRVKIKTEGDGKAHLDIDVHEKHDSEDGETHEGKGSGGSERTAAPESGSSGGVGSKVGKGIRLVGSAGKSLGSAMTMHSLFFLLAMILHLVIIFVFQLGAGTTAFIMYVAFQFGLGMFYHFLIRELPIKSSFLISVFGAILYCLPAVAERLAWSTVVHGIAFWVAIFFPVWGVFALQRLSQESLGWHRVFVGYKLIVFGAAVLLIFGYVLFPTLRAIPSVGLGGVDIGDAFGNVFDTFVTAFANIGKGITQVYNDTINPDKYYRGTVEQNSLGDLGLRFEDFRPIDSEITEDMPLVIYGTLYATSFLEDTDSVTVTPSCVIDRRDVTVDASVDPSILDIVYGTASTFDCNFGTLERGTYRVEGFATFPFQTWAYITYTFVDDERARNFARQGLDVRRELDIDPEPRAVFTSGPLKIGMGGTPQPIRLDPTAADPVPTGTRIGLTLDPNWGDGELHKVHKIELKVPEPFEIYECDRCLGKPDCPTRIEQDPFEPAYTNYVFENTYSGPISAFTSITCKLGVVGDLSMLSESDKVLRSFIGVAYYDYTINTVASVRVR